MARPSLKERRKQQEAIRAKRNRSRSWNKANPRPQNKGNASAYNEAMKVWKAKKKAQKNPTPQTAKDKDDARKESELASVLKNKPKGGSKDTSPKPKPTDKSKAAPKKKNNLKPAPWGRNDDGSPKKQPSASSQIATHKKSVAKAKAKEKGKVEREENEWGPGGQPSASKQIKQQKDNEKAAWLKKTRNSPAAKSGAFTDDERWKQQQRHRAWKASRKKKKQEVSYGQI